MEPAVLSAVSALAGSAIGAFASLATAWVSQRGTHRQQRLTTEIAKREALYVEFMQEAARLLLDSLEHEGAGAMIFANLYALMGRIRLFATPPVADQAEAVMEHIILTYAAPNKTFAEVAAERKRFDVDPLKHFSEACRVELDWVRRG
jgi:hypothetical protein